MKATVENNVSCTRPGTEMKKVVFFGAGKMGKLGVYYAKRSNMKVEFIVDNNSKLWESNLEGIKIVSPDVLKQNSHKYIVIVTVGTEIYNEIKEQLVQSGYVENENLFEYSKIFLQGNTSFGEISGVINVSSEVEVKKTVAKNKLLIDKKNKWVYRLINENSCEEFKEIYKRCKEGKIFDEYVIKTELSDKEFLSKYPLCYKHKYIPLFTFAMEWGPQMFYQYTLFMMRFLRRLDQLGLGLGDGHAFNTTFHNGKFVFVDFDALKLGKTLYYTLQEFINSHILIIMMLSENLMDKVYFYLSNPNQPLSIKDIAGYLSETQLADFNNVCNQCYVHSTNGDIQKCCDILEAYVDNIKLKQIVQSTWEGYQAELYVSEDEEKWLDKQRVVVDMVRLVQPKTLLDLAGNMGWFEYVLRNEIEQCIVADLDYNCVDFVFDMVIKRNVKNIHPVYLNLVAPTPASYRGLHIGETAIIPWRENAIQRFKSEMVIALAIVHHLAFSQQLSFTEIIGQFAMYTSKWLMIEFIDRGDCIVAPALKNSEFDWYTIENFEKELKKVFNIICVKNSNPTRIVYLCEKK